MIKEEWNQSHEQAVLVEGLLDDTKQGGSFPLCSRGTSQEDLNFAMIMQDHNIAMRREAARNATDFTIKPIVKGQAHLLLAGAKNAKDNGKDDDMFPLEDNQTDDGNMCMDNADMMLQVHHSPEAERILGASVLNTQTKQLADHEDPVVSKQRQFNDFIAQCKSCWDLSVSNPEALNALQTMMKDFHLHLTSQLSQPGSCAGMQFTKKATSKTRTNKRLIRSDEVGRKKTKNIKDRPYVKITLFYLVLS